MKRSGQTYFITNDVKGSLPPNKQLKHIKYFKDNLCIEGILISKETYLTYNDESL